jgi:hypothetical protein
MENLKPYHVASLMVRNLTRKGGEKRMIELNQNNIVDLMIDKIKQNGPSRHGTYNEADPTAFEKGSAVFGLEGGYTLEPYDDETQQAGGYPNPENVECRFHDVTWGVTFEFVTSLGTEKGYWGRPIMGCDGQWTQITDRFFEVFKDILLCGREKDFWEIDDDLSAMGYYSCR